MLKATCKDRLAWMRGDVRRYRVFLVIEARRKFMRCIYNAVRKVRDNYKCACEVELINQADCIRIREDRMLLQGKPNVGYQLCE